jgi:putative mycofactocin binding protein MftB
VAPSALKGFDASSPWKLNEQVSLRDEEFGALAYHHVTRRLIFLKSRELVSLVRSLGDFASAQQAVESAVPKDQWTRFLKALTSLEKSEIISGR